MPTSYTSVLKLALPVTGELSGTWGDVVNQNITAMVEQAITGIATINTWTGASHTLTVANGTTSESRCAILECSGIPGAAATVICPTASKIYIVKNLVTGGFAVTLKTSAGTGISIPNGKTIWLYCDGTNVVQAGDYFSSLTLGTPLTVPNGGTGVATVTASYVPYGAGTSPLATSANLQFDGTVMRVGSNAVLGATTNPVVAMTGGTNNYIQSYIYNATNGASASADFVAYANNSTDAHGWADIGFTSSSYADATYTVTGPNEAYVFGSALNSTYTGNLVYATDNTGSANSHQWYVGGFAQAKGAWKMQLTSTGLQLSSALAAAYGGTGLTAPGASGNVLTSNGTGWVSSANGNGTVTSVAISGGTTGLTTSGGPITTSGTVTFAGTLIAANGGTGLTTPGASGNVLTSNGTAWTSAAAGASLSGVTQSTSPYETSLGYQAGNVTTGTNNTWIGYQAGLSTTTGESNTAVGFRALDQNITGGSNTAMGSNALGSFTSNGGTAFGASALAAATTGRSQAFGDSALFFNTTGTGNNAFGTEALRLNTTGFENCAFGDNSLRSNTTGQYNVAVGSSALRGAGVSNSGSNNTAVGHTAGYSMITGGSNNTAVGYQALYQNTSGIRNTAVGVDSLVNVTTGERNTALGSGAGDNVTTGLNNVFVGSNAGSVTTGSNNILIGYNVVESAISVSNEVTLGNTDIVSTRLRGVVELNAAMFEQATISATAATGTINFYARSQSVLYYTTAATGNWTMAITGASGVTLNSIMQIGQSLTIAFLATNNATAYYQSALTVDGAAVTPKWQGGTAPAAGNASAIDVYSITIIKTAAATFTALAAQTKFA